MVTLATSDGEVHTEIVDTDASPLRAGPNTLDVDMGPGLHVEWERPRTWSKAFGPLGPAQMIPFLGQYWAPHLLDATTRGTYGTRSLDGAHAYSEKNWGAAFAEHWWWGQAEFVAFAGGRIHGVAPTAIAVWTDRELISLAPPLARTVTRAAGGEWHVRAQSPRYRVELTGEAIDPHRLPVPIPGAERRLEIRSSHYLRGAIDLKVHRGRRLWFSGSSQTAALEEGAA